VIQKGIGTLVTGRRQNADHPAKPSYTYLPCEYCLVFIHEKALWQHCNACIAQTLTLTEVPDQKNAKRNGQAMLTPFIAATSSKERDDCECNIDDDRN
jgi:hypothetical protein